jgi:hypothetical protein
MSLEPDKVGMFFRGQAEELTRIWRLARAAARPDVFPGLVDALVHPFFERAGDLLASGGAPEEVWHGLVGLVRWPPALSPGELTHEWAVMVEVVGAGCESVNAAPAATEWLTRAVNIAERGSVAIAGGHGLAPEGIVTTVVFSSVSPRRPATDGEPQPRS